MHRNFRCAFVVLISTLLVVQNTITGYAQDTGSSQTGTIDSTTTSATASAHKRTTHKKRHIVRRRRTTRSTGIPSDLNSDSDQASSKDRLSTVIRLSDGVRTWKPSRRMLGVSYANGGTNNSTPGTFEFTVDRDKLKRYLSRIKGYTDRSATVSHPAVVSANPDDDGTEQAPATIIAGHDGEALDVNASVDRIQHAVQSQPTTTHLDLVMVTKHAAVSEQDLTGIDTRIGYFVTRFNAGDVGRTQTVRRAIELIDKTVVPPGATFSINKSVGERTAERGFGSGHVFVDGHMEVQLGGGMCQVATTLFNAAMIANLKIVERHQHVRTIPYASPGRDATVYWGQKDFKFQNDTDAPIYISYKTNHSHAIISLFGKGVEGRKVKLISHYRRLGERHYTGVFYRVVSYPDGRVEKSTPYYSNYDWPPTLDYSR